MKKSMVLVFALVCVLFLVGCTCHINDNTAETGYPTGEIQQPQIMYNGQVYFYFATGFDEPLPDGFEYVGSVTGVDNIIEPIADFFGARVELGQEIYADDANSDTIYVKYKNGYAQFLIR